MCGVGCLLPLVAKKINGPYADESSRIAWAALCDSHQYLKNTSGDAAASFGFEGVL